MLNSIEDLRPFARNFVIMMNKVVKMKGYYRAMIEICIAFIRKKKKLFSVLIFCIYVKKYWIL